ncbi:rhodanese-like domain-containing protein [bacterium]|nr:rhodanese-like domain-containing protein [bacterium]
MRNNRFYYLLITLSTILFVTACSNSEENFKDAGEMAANAKSKIETVTAEEFKAVMETGSNYTLLDCREPIEFNVACIPGAINIPRGLLEFKLPDKVQKRKTTIYIYSENDQRAALSAVVLMKLKYSNVFVIDGGWNKWLENYPDLFQENPHLIESKEEPAPVVEEEGGCG